MSKRISTPSKSEKPKKKVYYSENEEIWIKPLKTFGTVMELKLDTKEVFVSHKNDDALVVSTFKLWQIGKLRTPKVTSHTPPKTNTVDNNTLLFAKVKPNAIIPSKRDEDGCYDVYACFEEDQIAIEPGECILIPLGIASVFSSKFRVELRERGSTGVNCMSRRAGQIDSGYRGEWFFPLNNTGNRRIIISKMANVVANSPEGLYYPYAKAIGQAALEIVPTVTVTEVSYEELQAIPSQRGIGKIGSSGK
jgi:dUTP pyrophosphatase